MPLFFFQNIEDSYEETLETVETWGEVFYSSLPKVAIACGLIILAFFIGKLVRKLVKRSANRLQLSITLTKLLGDLSMVLFWFILLFLILSIFNLDSTINKILATAGVVGLAVGLALQDPMNNLFSGIFLSIRNIYRINDLVETNGYFGTINSIDLRITKIKLPSGEMVIIPNKDVIQNPLKNYTITGERRVDVDCGVAYNSDLALVEDLVVNAVQTIKGLLPDKNVDFMWLEFAESAIKFRVRFWIMATSSQKDYLQFKSEAIKAIKSTFDSNEIIIPFPIRTLEFGPSFSTINIQSKE